MSDGRGAPHGQPQAYTRDRCEKDKIRKNREEPETYDGKAMENETEIYHTEVD